MPRASPAEQQAGLCQRAGQCGGHSWGAGRGALRGRPGLSGEAIRQGCSSCSAMRSPTPKMPRGFGPSQHEDRVGVGSPVFPALGCTACTETGLGWLVQAEPEGRLTSLEEVKFTLQVVEHLHCQLETGPKKKGSLSVTASPVPVPSPSAAASVSNVHVKARAHMCTHTHTHTQF